MKMRTKIFMGALVALLAVACSKEQIPEQKGSSTAEGLVVSASVEQPGDGSKTSLDGLSVKWSVGDRIYLTDGTNTAVYQATTASSSTSFSYVSGATTLEGDVYAYYPADNATSFDNTTKAFTATIPAVQPYVAGGFADGVNPMTAKATVTEGSLVLSFKNVMSFVKLQIADSAADKTLTGLSLTSPSVNLCGTATVTVGTDGVATTAIATGTKTVELGGLYVPLSTVATPLYIAVPTGDLGKLKITAKTAESTGAWSQSKTSGSTLNAARSSINSYNPMQISSITDERTRISEVPANCYMIDATKQTSISMPLSQALAGWDAIKALESDAIFDKTKITSGTRSINVRWFNGASGTITKTGIDSDNLTLTFTDVTNGSNAVVDLKNGDEIVWSWHLWFTDYKPGADQDHTTKGQVHTYPGLAFQEGGLYYGKVMMDRNLGAIATNVNGAISQPASQAEAISYFGLYYQFGRKDPFPTYGGNFSVYDASEDKVTYANATQNPDTFYHIDAATPQEGGTWCQTDLDAETPTDPWNSTGEKSALDPCPNGWRIPRLSKDGKYCVFNGLTAETHLSASSLRSGNLWNGDVWLPDSGIISGEGNYYRTGQSCQIWGSGPQNAVSGSWMRSQSDGVNTYFGGWGARALGMPVRCVQE